MVEAWRSSHFGKDEKYKDLIQVSFKLFCVFVTTAVDALQFMTEINKQDFYTGGRDKGINMNNSIFELLRWFAGACF